MYAWVNCNQMASSSVWGNVMRRVVGQRINTSQAVPHSWSVGYLEGYKGLSCNNQREYRQGVRKEND